jgi:hypothetical protein
LIENKFALPKARAFWKRAGVGVLPQSTRSAQKRLGDRPTRKTLAAGFSITNLPVPFASFASFAVKLEIQQQFLPSIARFWRNIYCGFNTHFTIDFYNGFNRQYSSRNFPGVKCGKRLALYEFRGTPFFGSFRTGPSCQSGDARL